MKTFDGIYRVKNKIATLNSTPGYRVYDEKLANKDGREYRIWDPYRSKLAAAIMNDLEESPYKRNSNVLYLGASSGTTASHLADVCSSGLIYCVEFSRRMMRELLQVTEKKPNMFPILADASKPEEYVRLVSSVDVIYQDVAQSKQAEILLKNTAVFSPKYAMLSIKSRSINAVKSPNQVFREETDKLRGRFDVLQRIDLRPYDKDHVLLNLRSKR
jgi:fibrillarin-like pre-rRNA processing protein